MWSEAAVESSRREASGSSPPAVEVIRHLRRAGKGEIVVAVPRAWVKNSGLEIGGSMSVREAGPGRLILEDTRASSQVWVTGVAGRSHEPLEHLFRCLVASYLTGTPEVVLTFAETMSQEVRKTVREFARRTGRMEVVAETPTSLTLRDISGNNSGEPVPVVVRMARAVLELQRRAGESLVAPPSAEEDSYWETQDDEVDRLEWRVHRALASQALRLPASSFSPQGAPAGLHLLAMARALERVGDHAVKIGRASASLPRPLPQPPRIRSVVEFHGQVLNLLERVIPLVEHPDPRAANEVVDVAESLHASHMALLQSLLSRRAPSQLPPLTAAWLALVLDSVDRSAAYVADIAELSLDRAALEWVHSQPAESLMGSPGPRPVLPPSLSSRKGGIRP